MSERRWTTALLALLGILLLARVMIRNSFAGYLFTGASGSKAPGMMGVLVYFGALAASLSACFLVIRYRESWWRSFQGRLISQAPITTAALARCTLLLLGAWLILEPLMELLVQTRDWLLSPSYSFWEPSFTEQVDWIRYTVSMALGLLLSVLSCPLAAWFERTQTRRKPLPEAAPEVGDSEPGD